MKIDGISFSSLHTTSYFRKSREKKPIKWMRRDKEKKKMEKYEMLWLLWLGSRRFQAWVSSAPKADLSQRLVLRSEIWEARKDPAKKKIYILYQWRIRKNEGLGKIFYSNLSPSLQKHNFLILIKIKLGSSYYRIFIQWKKNFSNYKSWRLENTKTVHPRILQSHHAYYYNVLTNSYFFLRYFIIN